LRVLADVRAIAFDLDNTLWDVEPVLARAEARLYAWLAERAPRITGALTLQDMRAAREALARAEPHNAHDFTYLRTAALAAHARAHGYADELAQEAFEVFLAARCEVTLYADVPQGLARLARRFPLASLSNGNADLARIGLSERFVLSLNAREIGAAKPDPRCFARLAEGLALPARAVAYVGDDPRLDVAAARAAGLASVWISRHAREWPAGLPRADLAVSDLGELADALGA
jgi:putative hydrolase of the HAD superfamily